MQNIQSMLRNIGIAVIVVIIIADAFCYGKPVMEAVSDTIVADTVYEEETETQTEEQTEDIVENVIAEIESDEVHLVMGSNTQEKETEVVVEVETETESPKPVISYSTQDYNNLLKIVEAEATGCDVIGKILVANVIINRVKDPRFANSVTGVVFQGNGEQFSPVKDGRFYSVVVTKSTVEAVDRALLGEDYSQGALYFAATHAVTPDCWHSTHLKKLFEYDGHVFFNYF